MKFKKRATGLIALACLTMASQVHANGTPAPEATPDTCKNVGYDKGLFIQSDDCLYKMKFNIQLQPQYQFLSVENSGKTNGFQMRRARVYFSGNAVVPNLTYKAELEIVGGAPSIVGQDVTIAHTGPNVREAYLSYKVNDAFQIKGGEFKPAFTREELTSSTQFQFVDQSIMNDVFTESYDLGISFFGSLFEKKLLWNTFVTNEGNNRNNFNPNNEMLLGGRLDWNIMGDHGFTQSDVSDSDKPNWMVGAAGVYNKPFNSGQNTMLGVTADTAFRYNGFSLIGAGGFADDHTLGRSVYGFLGQVGYFLIPTHLEVAARGAGVITRQSGLANGYELGGDINYFFKGHNLKLQADYSMLINSPLALAVTPASATGVSAAANFITRGGNPGFRQDQNDHRFRLQAQLFF